ncbi:YraN family protein [Nonomuraea sp. NPDC002799]
MAARSHNKTTPDSRSPEAHDSGTATPTPSPRRTNSRLQLGKQGEEVAVTYLEAEGMKVIDRNWRCRYGEIDIIAEEGPNLVVVEVKTRSGRSHGTALESVSQVKLARLRMLAAKWLATQPATFEAVRVDVIALERFAGDFALCHVRGAI